MKQNQLAHVNKTRVVGVNRHNEELRNRHKRSGKQVMAQNAERGLWGQQKDGKYIAERRTFI